MKLLLALMLFLICQEETYAGNYISGKTLSEVREDGDIILFSKLVDVHEDYREENFPGPYDYSPYTITRIAVYDWGKSNQISTDGGVGFNHFSMFRKKGSHDNNIGYDIWIFGKHTGDCLVKRTVNETLKIVEEIKSHSV